MALVIVANMLTLRQNEVCALCGYIYVAIQANVIQVVVLGKLFREHHATHAARVQQVKMLCIQ